MKRLLLVFCLLSFTVVSSQSQDKDKIDVSAVLNKILINSAEGNLFDNARYFAYKNSEGNIEAKTTYDVKEPSEKFKVKRLSKRIQKYLKISSTYEISNYSVDIIGNTNHYILSVSFYSKQQKLDIEFDFIKRDGLFYLFDID